MGTSLLWQTDGQLHDAVRRQLDWEPNINAEEIALLASDGVITLTGFVNTYGEKLAAEQAVKRVRGVRAVADNIHVRLLNERSDPDIAKDAVHALQSHTDVPRSVTVTVRDGLVTLDGTVEWNYQRTAAESAVRHLKGVKGVSNAIYIKPVASPGQVQTLINDALVRSAEVDAHRIQVNATDGTVTLTGTVSSLMERDEAERAAWSARGVSRVENQLVVAP
jgi:osmotically-inducible protein OsmY